MPSVSKSVRMWLYTLKFLRVTVSFTSWALSCYTELGWSSKITCQEAQALEYSSLHFCVWSTAMITIPVVPLWRIKYQYLQLLLFGGRSTGPQASAYLCAEQRLPCSYFHSLGKARKAAPTSRHLTVKPEEAQSGWHVVIYYFPSPLFSWINLCYLMSFLMCFLKMCFKV